MAERLTNDELRPNGDRLLTPSLDPERFAYQVVIEGVFTFGYTGEQFDALYRDRGTGRFTERHPHLHWSPVEPHLVSEDREGHRYVFTFPPGALRPGASAGVRVEIDRFISEFLIPRSEVDRQLSGALTVQVLRSPLAATPTWGFGVLVGLPTLAVLGGAAWVLRRRMAFQGLPPELAEQIARIDRKAAAARAALRGARAGVFPLRERLVALQEAGVALTREIRKIRASHQLLDRAHLEREIADLARQAEARGAPHPEAERLLAEKRQNLLLLESAEEAEAACRLRLSRIETMLDAACLTLRRPEGITTPGATDPDALCRDMDAELSALRELDLPTVQLAGRR
jgi:hypothetical protein